MASPGFVNLIRTIESEADLVILDAPPVLPVSDALSMSRQVDAVLVVAKAGQTTRDRLAETLDNLDKVGANVIGVCLTDTDEGTRYGAYEAYTADEPRAWDRRGRRNGRVIDVREPVSH